MSKTILALDLGTNTGFCFGSEPDELFLGTDKFATAKEVREWGKNRMTRRCDPRVLRFYDRLHRFRRPDIVVFEDVEFSSYTKQTQLWASFRTAVWLAFGVGRVLVECVPVGTLKRFATGAGNANKNGMARAASRLGLDVDKLDDNAIDAYHLWRWAHLNLTRTRKGVNE